MLVSLGLLAAACGKSTAKPDYGYPLDDKLRLNHLQMKGTHNSYHIQPENPQADEWRYTHLPLADQLEKQGVRQFELDVHYHSDEGRFHVYHLPTLDDRSTCALFTDCLTQLLTWSNAHPGHHPLFVYIEPKDDIDADADKIIGHFDELDAEILKVWPRDRVLTPDDLQGSHPTLREAVLAEAWPTLGEMRGKIVFDLLTEDRAPGETHYDYTHGLKDLHGRTMFVTAQVTDPYAAVLKLDDPVGDAQAIKDAVSQGFIVRTYPGDPIVNGHATSRAQMDAAEASPAHMLSSDYPVPGIVADYFLDLSGGTPSRCNPSVAPPDCTSDAIEGPTHLQARK